MIDIAVMRDNFPFNRGTFDNWRCWGWRGWRWARARRRSSLPLHQDANAFAVMIRGRGPGSPALDDAGVYIDTDVAVPLLLRGRRGRALYVSGANDGRSRGGTRRRAEATTALDVPLPDDGLGAGAAWLAAVDRLDLPLAQHQGPSLGPLVVLAEERGDPIPLPLAADVDVDVVFVFSDGRGGPSYGAAALLLPPLVDVDVIVLSVRRPPRVEVPVVCQVAATRATVRHGGRREVV